MKIYLSQTAESLLIFLQYIIPCIVVLLCVRFLCKPKSYIFRKLLHLVAFSCVTVMILFSESWQAAALASIVITIVVYPILALLEGRKWFAGLFVQKSPGEIKRSLVMLFMMFAALTAVSWGIFGKRDACAAAILMWGTGDAAAALIGIPYGAHKVISRFTDGKKSYEGSFAMVIVSFLTGLFFLRFYAAYPWTRSLVAALLGSVAGALCELFSPSELDTISVPTVILAVLLWF